MLGVVSISIRGIRLKLMLFSDIWLWRYSAEPDGVGNNSKKYITNDIYTVSSIQLKFDEPLPMNLSPDWTGPLGV